MKRSIREAKTEELIEALMVREGIEYIETDESEKTALTIESASGCALSLPQQRYQSLGRVGPEIIIRCRRDAPTE